MIAHILGLVHTLQYKVLLLKQMLLQVFKSIIPLDMIKSQVNNALHCIIKSLYINILTCILKYSGGFRVLGKLDEL